MNNSLLILTSLALLAIGTLMVVNFVPTPNEEVTAPGLPPLQVKGAAVVHKGIPFTLNFEQQSLAKDAILKAVAVKKADYPEIKGPFDFDKIIIYRFNASDLEIFPIQYKDENLVFSSPEMSKDTYFMELSGGAIRQMINSSFDH